MVLSSRGDESAKVTALDSGADDYVTKLFGVDELMARLRKVLRHRLQQQGAERGFSSDDLTVDMVRRLVRRGSEDVKLSPKEYDLLEQLVIHAGKVLTHKHLLREVWHDELVDPQYLRVYVLQLRQKIEADLSRPSSVPRSPTAWDPTPVHPPGRRCSPSLSSDAPPCCRRCVPTIPGPSKRIEKSGSAATPGAGICSPILGRLIARLPD